MAIRFLLMMSGLWYALYISSPKVFFEWWIVKPSPPALRMMSQTFVFEQIDILKLLSV